MTASGLEFRVLGPLEVVVNGAAVDLGGPRQRAVLAVLLTKVNQVVSTDQLIDALWGDQPPATATGSLQSYISNLRRALEPDRPPRTPAQILVTRPPGYVLRVRPDQLDSLRFEHALDDARELLAADQPSDARSLIDDSLQLWRSDALADFTFEPFARDLINRLDELRLAAEEIACEATVLANDPATAVARLEGLVAANPLRERLRELVALALYRAGRQADALRACAQARALLLDELGVDPGPALRRLEQRILDHDPTLIGPGDGPPPASSETSGRTGRDDEQATEPFVGRSAELAQLDRAWQAALGGRTQGVVVSGEAGVGKTRLVEHFAASATPQAAQVIWARNCDGSGCPALWSWLVALRELPTNGCGDISMADEVEDPDTVLGARSRLFHQVANCLREAVEGHGPVVFVIDDFQWADTSTVSLFEFVLRAVEEVPLLIVATVRTDPPIAEVLTELFARLTRLPQAHMIDLVNFTQAEVDEYVAAFGSDLTADNSDDLAERLHARTDGNAFFVVETLRLLASQTGDLTTVPNSVRAVVGQRLSRLPTETRSTLEVATVIGREFGLGLLSRACELDVAGTFDALEPALVNQMITESPHQLGWFQFSHPIVPEAVYLDLPLPRRARLHSTIAECLTEDLAQGEPDRGIVGLAHHYVLASPAGVSPQAVEAVVQAAQHEQQRMALTEAVTWWERGLSLLDLSGAAKSQRRHELLVGLGRARWLAGDVEGSTDALHQALDIAEELDEPELILASTVRGNVMTWRNRLYGQNDPRLIAALEGLLARSDDPVIRSRVGSYLALELNELSSRATEATERACEALELARQLDQPDLVAHALHAQVLIGWRPEYLAMQHEAAQQMTDLMPPAVPPNVPLLGRLVASTSRLMQADADGFVAEIDDCWNHAQREGLYCQQVPLAWARSTAALLGGDIDQAARLSEEAHRLNRRVEPLGSNALRSVQLLDIRRQQDRLVEDVDQLDKLSRTIPHSYGNTLTMGIVALAREDLDAAGRALKSAPKVRPSDWTALTSLSMQAELAAAVRSPLAADYYDALLPYADRAVVLGPAITCRGSVQHFLGLLAGVVRPDKARDHLTAAANVNRRLGLHWWADQSEAALA